VDGKVALLSDIGYYLARCNNCMRGAQYPSSASVNVNKENWGPYALWTPILKPNGKWALQSDNGGFLARCYKCVPGAQTQNLAVLL
jgi:hypothetical protein